MSLIPVFKIGLWNAWIFMLYSILALFILPLLFNKERFKVKEPYSKTEKKYWSVWVIIYFLTILYSFFVPLPLGTIWFYIGLPICLLGLILYTIGLLNFVTNPSDELVTRGLYRYSRHPIYLSLFLFFTGVSIASASWIFILFTVINMILCRIFSISEEEFCLERYGDSYRRYMIRTPRWIGIPKIFSIVREAGAPPPPVVFLFFSPSA
jgi:protein-S-isoprenylcysteine O-methyltransferase Ste14